MENVKKVDCGSEYTLCLTMDGKLYAWGKNNYGQLGITGKQSNKENKPTRIV
jgi:alpha-tubulin suppressor-like RCC1 family protein